VSPLDRREFLQFSTAALLSAAGQGAAEETRPARVTQKGGSLRAEGKNYAWEWVPSSDQFSLRDTNGRLVTTSILQPLVMTSPVGHSNIRRASPGKFVSHSVEGGGITFYYEGVNGQARLSTTWRFEDQSIRADPLVYETPLAEDVVSVHYFAEARSAIPFPALKSTYLIDPGISEGSSVSPIVRADVGLDTLSWLGHGSFRPGLSQQWALPVHFFCGFNIDEHDGIARDSYTTGRSDAFCCGLTELPNGDLFLHLKSGQGSVVVNYRSDLWAHLRGPGRMSLGVGLFWAFGSSYYEAIRAYYLGLLNAGIIHKKQNSEQKTAVALTPQFCTWGAQVDRGKGWKREDETFLRSIYKELRDSGMRAGMFSIDATWEGRYGTLKASSERFPHFLDFLNEVRAGGHRIGLWSAFMRCEDPQEIGLTTDNMLRGPDGKPYMTGVAEGEKYYILDLTQPKVERVFKNIVQDFVRRYNPDLVKFDFGYELPSLDIAAPADRRYAGERLLKKGLEIVVGAMREVNPDIVLMYYQLSPLFLDELDLHSPDDLFLCAGEYDLEANRRFFFSSLLGDLGVPTYGSSGYDWQSSPNIWFDSAVVGTLGSLNDFQGDEQGEKATPERIAKYNGLTHVLRSSNFYRVVPLDVDSEAPTRGAHSRSWARFENGQLVLVAIRPAADVNGAYNESRFPEKQVRDVIRTTVPVVVASRTSDGIESANLLGVVPYGDGEVSIRRPSPGVAEVTEHWFGGTLTRSRVQVRNDYCDLTAKTRRDNGASLEWMEVRFSD
jgi:Glycosyl hydrolases family 31 TIM-barrel domain